MKEEKLLKLVQEEQLNLDWNLTACDDATLYYLSKERENILNWYSFDKSKKLLEVDAACGSITRMLCQRVQSVLSIESTERRAQINQIRNQKYSNLEIKVGRISDFVFQDKFDYIIVNDLFAYASNYVKKRTDKPYEEFLEELEILLNPGGRVLIATDNRMGLQYFSGAMEGHTNSLFQGLTGFPKDSVTTFSKNEWENMLKESSFTHSKFYYPYPNHIFPNEIYTDESIDTMDYGKEYYNFKTNRLQFFNESAVAKTFQQEKIAKYFSNSFLIEAVKDNDCALENVIYVKMDSDRDEKFQIGTKIVEEDGIKQVYKYPLVDDAYAHMEHIFENDQIVVNERLKSLQSTKCGRQLKYPYLSQITLNDKVKNALKLRNKQKFIEILDHIFRIAFSNAQNVSYHTKDFQNVFGKTKGPEELECVNPANIDLICDNIFCQGNQYIVIDNEWIFDFFVPKSLIIWRNIIELYLKYPELELLCKRAELLERYYVSPSLESVLISWNEYFTLEYVGANRMEKFSVNRKLVSFTDETSLIESNLYINQGLGYSESHKVKLNTQIHQQKFSIEYKLENLAEIRSLRWDPVEGSACACQVYIKADNKNYRLKAINAECVSDDYDVFLNADPQYEIVVRDWTCPEIEIYGRFYYPNKEQIKLFVFEMSERWRKKEIYIQQLEDSYRNQGLQLQNLVNEKTENRIREEKNREFAHQRAKIENSKGWKLLQLFWRLKAKVREKL